MNVHILAGYLSEHPTGNFVSLPGLLSFTPEYRKFFSLDYTIHTYYILKKKIILINFGNIKQL